MDLSHIFAVFCIIGGTVGLCCVIRDMVWGFGNESEGESTVGTGNESAAQEDLVNRREDH
jgi:hypothetical protein